MYQDRTFSYQRRSRRDYHVEAGQNHSVGTSLQEQVDWAAGDLASCYTLSQA